ncbi:MAG: hypothetical protein GTO17_13955 [Candidatus Aminicenantes bacterium]|nr:hypothetical protein [Candidatus Aminicenantes bacterium]
MKCKKVCRLLPLLAGSDLPARVNEETKAHLHTCPSCQKEYESYLLSFRKTKEWLERGQEDLPEEEWQGLIQQALQVEEFAPSFRPRWRFRRAWAYALMAGAVLILSLFILRPAIFRDKTGWGAKEEADLTIQQESISMTMVSQETGLKIVWFFNKNFELKEER